VRKKAWVTARSIFVYSENRNDLCYVPLWRLTLSTRRGGGLGIGIVLGLALPQKTEVLRQNLVFEAVTKEYKNSAGSFKKAGINLGGEPVTLSGLVLMVLNSDATFGPF
jgi:hypothetical protein